MKVNVVKRQPAQRTHEGALAKRIDAWLDGVVSAIERPHDDHSVAG